MSGNQEQRHVYYDHDLGVEAYQLRGVVQKFPNHFHDFYVIGFIEGGKRHLWCKGSEYDLRTGNLVLFNPRDNHYCAPVGGDLLDYRAVNIRPKVMLDAAREIAGKEEAFFYLLEQILLEYSSPFEASKPDEPDEQIKILCAYMEQHFAENITLEDMLSMTTFGKSYLLRLFTEQVGVSPYRYLQTIRIGKAKKLSEQGMEPIDVAGMAGFSHQSHFTNFFKSFIGLTPKQYQRIFFYGLLFMLPISCVMGFQVNLSQLAEGSILLNLLFLGFGASALCFVTWNTAVKQLGSVKTSVYIYMVPVITAVTSALILHETITPAAVCGIVLTLAGLFLSEHKAWEKKVKTHGVKIG